MIRKSIIKIISLMLIIGLNWAGLSAVIETVAYYFDNEDAANNVFIASTLDFSLTSLGDFSPEVLPTQTSGRNISVVNDGILDFEYDFNTANFDGGLCDFLFLDAYLDGNSTALCSGDLNTFTCNVGIFTSPESWQFTAALNSSDPSLENQHCDFDFVFDGSQIGGAGFSDQEIISNTITSGQWVIPPPPPAGLKINEVYYDVLESKHCKEGKNEWVELYNPTNSPISLKKWELCHAYGKDATCNTINTEVDIPAFGFAAVEHDNSTWVHCFPDVPSITIHNLGGSWPELGNDGDYVILKNPSGTIVDCVGWGNDPNTCGFSDGTVTDVAEGHSIARKIKGVDIDTADDWQDLTTPNPGTNPHLIDSEEIATEESATENEEFSSEDLLNDDEAVDEEITTDEEAPLEKDLIIPEEDNETGGETTEDVVEDTASETDESAVEETSEEEVSADEEQSVTLSDDGSNQEGGNDGVGDGDNPSGGDSGVAETGGESTGDSGDAGETGETISE